MEPQRYESERPSKASAEEAARVVHLLLASYPHEAKNADVYARQLIEVCAGVDMAALREMVNPRTGLVSTAKFLPSVAEVVDWLHDFVNEPSFAERWNRLAIEDQRRDEPEQVSDEERDRRANMLRETAAVIREAAKATQRHGLPPLKPIQVDCREEIAKGTLHIPAEQMRRTSSEAA